MQRDSFDESAHVIRYIRPSTSPIYINVSTSDCTHQNATDQPNNSTPSNIQEQLQLISERLTRVEQSASSRRPTSSCSNRLEHSTDVWTNLFQAEEEIKRLRVELAKARSQINNNQAIAYPSYPMPLIASQSISHPQLTNPLTNSSTQSKYSYPSSSAFKPVQQPVSDNFVHNSQLATPIITNASPAFRPSPLFTPPIAPLLSSPPSNNPAFISTSFTMTLNNFLPKFTGAADERPVQFLTEFETRATALVGHNDILLLHTVQQTLSEGALLWFSQLQKSIDRVHNWTTFKERFYERYRTPAKIQHFRTELRLLFQRDNESTLDYFERLKALLVEIDLDCNEQWLKHKFIQKLRSEIRTRLDIDLNLSIRDIVRKAQATEASIEQQKVDEKLKLAILQEQKSSEVLFTNNVTFDNTYHQRPPPASPITKSFTLPTLHHRHHDHFPSRTEHTSAHTNAPLPLLHNDNHITNTNHYNHYTNKNKYTTADYPCENFSEKASLNWLKNSLKQHLSAHIFKRSKVLRMRHLST